MNEVIKINAYILGIYNSLPAFRSRSKDWKEQGGNSLNTDTISVNVTNDDRKNDGINILLLAEEFSFTEQIPSKYSYFIPNPGEISAFSVKSKFLI